MSEDQEALTLATQTTMTPQDAKFFLWLLVDWQRKYSLSDELLAEIKQTAIDSAHVQDISPVTMLAALYQTWKAYRGEQTRESFAKAMEFRAGIKRLEAGAGRTSKN